MPLPPNAVAELQRDMARLGFVVSQIREIEEARQKRLEQQPETGPHAMVRLLARIVGVGVETADLLVHELLSRLMRDRRAVARYAGLTGAPDESGARRREQGLARAGNPRVRRAMIQLAWRFLMFQKESALALWYRARTADSRSGTRKTMIVALARKLIIALRRFVTAGEPLEGVVLRISELTARGSSLSQRRFRPSRSSFRGRPAIFFIPASDRGALIRPRRLCCVEFPVALFDAASPLVPGNGGADMVRASPLACRGDFPLRLAACQSKNLIVEARRAALPASWFRGRSARTPG